MISSYKNAILFSSNVVLFVTFVNKIFSFCSFYETKFYVISIDFFPINFVLVCRDINSSYRVTKRINSYTFAGIIVLVIVITNRKKYNTQNNTAKDYCNPYKEFCVFLFCFGFHYEELSL